MKPGMKVYGTIVSRTLNNIVAYVNQIYDEDKELFQSDINSRLQTSIDSIDTELNNKIAQEIDDRLAGDQVLLNAIDLLNANSSTQGSVQYWIKQAIDAVIADAPEAFDTLKEIADWIAQDEHGTAALINRVAANEEAIAAINRAITQLENTLSQTDQRLSDAISTANSEIDQLQSDIAADIQDLQQFKTDIRDEVESDISTAVTDSIARELEIWTDVNRIDGRVTTVSNKVTEVDNTVKGITDANGNIKYTQALQSVIDTGISNNTAFNNISARWAVLDENQQVLEWMAAGFKSQVSPSTSFASVYAAANQSTSNAISNLTTTVNNLGDTYVAKARLLTEVESIVKNDIGIQSFSEIALDSDVSAAEARMASQYSTLDTNVRGISTTLAGVSTKADANEAKVNAITTTDSSSTTVLSQSALNSAMLLLLGQGGSLTKTTIQSLAYEEAGSYFATIDISTIVHNAVEDEISQAGVASKSYVDGKVSTAETTIYSYLKDSNNNIISSASILNTANANEAKLNALATWSGNTPTGYKYTSGLITEANKDSAIALLFAQGTSSTSKTNVMAMITAEVQGEVSSLTLTADKIYLNANETLANTIRATQGTIGGFTIGADSLSYGDNVSGRFSIVADETNGPQLNITGSAGAEESHGVCLNESGLTFYTNYRRLQQYVETNKINLDGSGSLASGALSWNSSGVLTLNGSNDGRGRIYVGQGSSINMGQGAIYFGGENSGAKIQFDGSSDNSSLDIFGSYIRMWSTEYPLLITGKVCIGTSYDSCDLNVGSNVFAAGYKIHNGTSAMFLKADGSTDSNTYVTSSALNDYLPKSGGTINGKVTINTPDGTTGYIFDVNGIGHMQSLTLSGQKGSHYGSIYFREDDYTKIYRDSYGLHIVSDYPDGGESIYIGSDDTNANNPVLFTSDLEGLDGNNSTWDIYKDGNAYFVNIHQNSDETLKNKVADVELTAEQIAQAPSIKFTWKDENKRQDANVGTIAQYWQEVLPEVVGKDRNDKFTLNYSTLATVSVISLAKEVVELKARIIELESKLNS